MSSSPLPGKRWLAHYRELLGTWTRRSGLPADTEDAVQESIAGLLAAKATVVDNPRAYLHRSIHNHLAEGYRRRQLVPMESLHDLQEFEHPAGSDAQAGVRTSQLLAAMKAALEELPPKCRQVFLWHRLEGYSHQEIAERLGLSVNMVERHMMRAARHLRERLGDFAP